MASLKEYRDERLKKLETLKSKGYDPYPTKANRTVCAHDLKDKFKDLEGKKHSVVGRITSIRSFGKIAFIVVKDKSGSVQIFLRAGEVTESDPKEGMIGISDIGLLDSGDFIQASGKVGKTQTGEISLLAENIKLLTKSLRPLPSYDGFSNKEERMRRRYIDTTINEDVYQRYLRRSKFWQSTRDFLNNEGFVEISTPVLENTTGGADAKPFVTHMDALDQDFYLRISHELPLKRLLGGGYEKVFDIGPRFRNENYSDEHLPEHVSMEWYSAYSDWQDGMDLTEKMVRKIADDTWGTRQFTLANGQKVDLGKDDEKFKRVSFVELIKKEYGLDVLDCTLEQAVSELKKIGGEVEKIDNRSRVIDKLWKKLRVDIAGPVFLIDIPKYLQPLAKVQPDNPELSEQFNLILGGTEACKAYSELNDPIDQLERFEEQQKMREAGDTEAMMLDIDFVEMLEYGMPPACGYGHSERLFWLLEGVTAREGVPFPQLRSEVSEVTKKIYPDIEFSNSANLLSSSRTQDFTKRIVVIVSKDLEKWKVANAVAHMSAIIGNNIDKQNIVAGDFFESKDRVKLPRNSQYPIIIMKASEKDLHKLYKKVTDSNLLHHVFIKEMIDTTDDSEIVESVKNKDSEDIHFLGLGFFGDNKILDKITKNIQLWK